MEDGCDLDLPDVSDSDMLLFQELFRRHIGLSLPASKKALLRSRLSGRMQALGLARLSDYHALIAIDSGLQERQHAIDLITTNETYFFREPTHFDYLMREVVAHWPADRLLRVWSAASSTGEEAYTLAMLLDHHRPAGAWSVFASDVSQRVLHVARRGLYPMARGEHIPPAYLKRYCLRGTGEYDGQFLVEAALREKVEFAARNLIDLDARDDGRFDVIFLRNVIIYFDLDTKRQVLEAVTRRLNPGGWLFVGHSESIQSMALPLDMQSPSIYRKPS